MKTQVWALPKFSSGLWPPKSNSGSALVFHPGHSYSIPPGYNFLSEIPPKAISRGDNLACK